MYLYKSCFFHLNLELNLWETFSRSHKVYIRLFSIPPPSSESFYFYCLDVTADRSFSTLSSVCFPQHDTGDRSFQTVLKQIVGDSISGRSILKPPTLYQKLYLQPSRCLSSTFWIRSPKTAIKATKRANHVQTTFFVSIQGYKQRIGEMFMQLLLRDLLQTKWE